MAQTASRDDIINTTILECLANGLTPSNQLVGKLSIIYTELDHVVHDDFFLDRRTRIGLLQSDGEALKEGFVNDRRRDEATSIIAFALSVSSADHIETRSSGNNFACFLDQNGLAFKHTLQTHQLV